MLKENTTTKRIFNFSAGPATLPEEILKTAQESLLNFNNTGMSIMEMSHRSKVFEAVLDQAKTGLVSLLDVPDTHEVLFLQGGASLQFSMVPINLKTSTNTCLVANTGSWTKKAIKEIKKEMQCNIIASSEDKNFSYIPTLNESAFNTPADFAYLCSNNTIFGTQFKQFPNTKNIPLVADMSSDILSRKIDVSKFGIIFAGAQKNVGPSGITIVIIRKELLARVSDTTPSMLQYKSFAESNSLFNTIPTFGIYMISLMTSWLQNNGGLEAMESKNNYKASLLYNTIDSSGYYTCPVNKSDRSTMNVVFRIGTNEALEKKFILEATEQGFDGLKGHRSVGGLRASIYNSHPQEGVEKLIEFMQMFQEKNPN
jgi:phosphoserine aminotransferase